jgi:pimeloyl-ACP methyl ester carboxylesterase
VDDYVDWTVDFAAALGLTEVILMNHSFGGRISIKLLARRPLPFEVKKAVFMDAAGIVPKRGLDYYVKVYSYKTMKKLFPKLAAKRQGKAGSADYRNASPLMRQTMVRCINEDLTHLLKDNPVSTLLIWGSADTATPLSDGQTMERLIPDAGLVVLEGAGHFAFAQQWGLCSRVLDSFLKGV